MDIISVDIICFPFGHISIDKFKHFTEMFKFVNFGKLYKWKIHVDEPDEVMYKLNVYSMVEMKGII